MTKRKKLVKQALKNPDNFSFGEIAFFERWLAERKAIKNLRKKGLLEQGDAYNTKDGGKPPL